MEFEHVYKQTYTNDQFLPIQVHT